MIYIDEFGLVMSSNVRWEQRFSNYKKALTQLSSAVQLAQQRLLSDLEKQGVIQVFEFTHELAWNVMKDYFAYQGNPDITGSRDAIREAFNKALLTEGEGWMEMIKSRNQSSHTYNHTIAEELVDKIINQYFLLFDNFAQCMQKRIGN